MKSRTSYFNKTLFLKNTTRFWPVWTLYLVIWILMMPVTIMNNDYGNTYSSLMQMRSVIMNMGEIGGLVMSGLFCFVMATLVFSFSYSARSASFMASLPLSRECVFITSYISGLFWFLASNVVVFLLSMLAEASGELDMTGLGVWLAVVSLDNFIFYSIVVICAVIAGNVIGAILLYGAANAGLIISELLLNLIASAFIKGLTFRDSLPSLLSNRLTPVLALVGKVVTTYDYVSEYTTVKTVEYTGWLSIGLYALAAAVLTALAFIVYRHRHMETASDLISVRPLRPVFKYLATAFCALSLGLLIYAIVFAFSTNRIILVPLIFCMIIGAAVGYFGSEMLLNKSFRVFRRWKGFAACIAAIIAVMLCIRLDVLGVHKYIPDAGHVTQASITTSGDDTTDFTDLENIKAVQEIHSLLIGDGYSLDVGGEADLFGDAAYDGKFNRWIRLDYTLDSGRRVEREYYAVVKTGSELTRKLDALTNSPEAILERVTPDITTTIRTEINAEIYGNVPASGAQEDYSYFSIYLDDSETAKELYDIVVEEAREGKLARIVYTADEEYNYAGDYNIRFSFTNPKVDGWEQDEIYVSVPKEAVRTRAYMQELIDKGYYDEYGNYVYPDGEQGDYQIMP